jgi:hypothetical protein
VRDKVYGVLAEFPEIRMKFFSNIREKTKDVEFIYRQDVIWVMVPEFTYAVVNDWKYLTMPVDKQLELSMGD